MRAVIHKVSSHLWNMNFANINVNNLKKLITHCDTFLYVFGLLSFNAIHTRLKINEA